MAKTVGFLQLTIYGILVLTAYLAFVMALDQGGFAIAIFLFVLVPLVFVGICLHGLSYLRRYFAYRSVGFFFQRGWCRCLRIVCGKRNTTWALNSYGVKLYNNQQYLQSIAALSYALQMDGGQSDLWAHRGLAYFTTGDFAEAIRNFTSALDIDSSNQIARIYRGISWGNTKETVKAIEDLQQIHCTTEQDSNVAHWRGSFFEELSKWDNALREYLLAHQLDPANIHAGIALARLQASCQDETVRDGNKAVENAIHLCNRTDWRDWCAISVLAAAYSELGNFEQAIHFAKQAFELAPESKKQERRTRIDQYQQGIPYRLNKQ